MHVHRSRTIAAGDVLTVGQVARLFKVSLQTLYYYEDEGLVCPQRDCGKRLYGQGAIRRLQFVLDSKRRGLSLASIAILLSEEDVRAAPHSEPAPGHQDKLPLL